MAILIDEYTDAMVCTALKAITSVAVSIACCIGCDMAHADPAIVHWHAGLLSVSANHSSRASLLNDVARQTGTEITGLPQSDSEITLHFKDMPLGTALKLIADDGGYALVRRDDGGRARYALYLVGGSANGVATGASPRLGTPVGRAGNGAVPPAMPTMPGPTGGSVTVTDDGG